MFAPRDRDHAFYLGHQSAHHIRERFRLAHDLLLDRVRPEVLLAHAQIDLPPVDLAADRRVELLALIRPGGARRWARRGARRGASRVLPAGRARSCRRRFGGRGAATPVGQLLLAARRRRHLLALAVVGPAAAATRPYQRLGRHRPHAPRSRPYRQRGHNVAVRGVPLTGAGALVAAALLDRHGMLVAALRLLTVIHGRHHLQLTRTQFRATTLVHAHGHTDRLWAAAPAAARYRECELLALSHVPLSVGLVRVRGRRDLAYRLLGIVEELDRDGRASAL